MEKISVKKPFTVLVAVIVVLALGIVSMTKMTTDLLPSISFPNLMVITTYPGASPERVESEVCRPLEDALGVVKNVRNVMSVSAENYGMVQIEFADGTDMDSAMVNVSSAVNQVAASLPEICGTPGILELGMDMIATMYVAVGYEGYDIYALSDYVDDEIVPHFQRQTGVASVTSVGLVEKSVQIDLNGDKIRRLNDRILEQTDSALAEAREALDEAQKKVDEGRAELKRQQSAFGRTLSSALFSRIDAGAMSDQLQNGVDSLIGALESLDITSLVPEGETQDTLTELREAVRELTQAIEMARKDAEALRPVLEDAAAFLEAAGNLAEQLDTDTAEAREEAARALAELQAALDALEESSGDPAASLAAMQSALSALQTVLQAAGEVGQTTSDAVTSSGIDRQLEELIAELRAISDVLDGGTLSSLISAALRLSAALGRLEALLDQIGAGSSSALDSLRETMASLTGSTGELATLLGTLEGVTAQLTQGQLDAALGFAEASRQLSAAQEQLSAAFTQYERSREQALSAANVDALVDATTLSQLIYAQNFAMPAGYIDDKDDNSWLLRVGDEYGSSGDRAETLLVDIDGIGAVRISDIADITVIDNAGASYTNLNGGDGVMLCIYKSSTAGTNEVSKNCARVIADLMAEDERLNIVPLVDQGKYITLIVDSIVESMVLGAALAIVVLALFLKDVRPTVLVGVSIPLSVLFTLVLMYFTGLSLNMMTLSGIALGIGMLVDNSIVVMENIIRLRGRGIEAPRASVQGTKQVAGSIIASTLTTVSVFLPMVFTSGTVREMLVPLSLSVSYCLAASLLVAMTVIPASASTLLRHASPKPNRLMDSLQKKYAKSLRWCLEHKALPLAVSIALLVFSLVRLLIIGIVVLPEMTSDNVEVEIATPEGDEREVSYAKVDQVMDAILTVEGIDDVGIMDTGSVIGSVGALSGTRSNAYGGYTCFVTVPKGAGKEEVDRICREIEEVCEGIDCEVSASSGGMMDFTAFVSSGLTVNIYGRDLDELARIAEDVAAQAEKIEGFTDVSTGREDAANTLHLVIDRDKAMEYGLTVAQIYAEIAGRLNTNVTSTAITVDGAEMDVTVSDETDPLTRENLLEMEFTAVSFTGDLAGGDMSAMLDAFSGEEDSEGEETEQEQGEEKTTPADDGVHKLREFATVEETLSASSINRENLTRYVTVTASTAAGYNTTVLVRSLQSGIRELERGLPDGYSIEISGESEQVGEMIEQMLGLAGLGLLFIYLVMVAQFQSLLSPFIILFTVPLAFTGGMLGLLVAGEPLSMLSIMGFLILMGTVVNNGIVFVDYTNQLRIGGLEKHDALVATGQTRMRPILMTAMTTILAMTQLIFGTDMGSQMGRGMAIVIAGGLAYATLMTLFIIPLMYDILYRRQPKDIDVGEGIDDSPDDAAEFLAELRAEREQSEAAAQSEETEQSREEVQDWDEEQIMKQIMREVQGWEDTENEEK